MRPRVAHQMAAEPVGGQRLVQKLSPHRLRKPLLRRSRCRRLWRRRNRRRRYARCLFLYLSCPSMLLLIPSPFVRLAFHDLLLCFPRCGCSSLQVADYSDGEEDEPRRWSTDTVVHSKEGGKHVSTYMGYVVEHSALAGRIVGLNLACYRIFTNAGTEERHRVLRAVAALALYAVHRVHGIRASPDPQEHPAPSLPHKLGALEGEAFHLLVTEHMSKLRRCFTADEIEQQLGLEFCALQDWRRQLSSAEVRRLDSGSTCFNDAWDRLSCKLPMLRRFAAGLATVAPGSTRVEGEFSEYKIIKNGQRSRLSDLAAEGTMYARQQLAATTALRRQRAWAAPTTPLGVTMIISSSSSCFEQVGGGIRQMPQPQFATSGSVGDPATDGGEQFPSGGADVELVSGPQLAERTRKRNTPREGSRKRRGVLDAISEVVHLAGGSEDDPLEIDEDMEATAFATPRMVVAAAPLVDGAGARTAIVVDGAAASVVVVGEHMAGGAAQTGTARPASTAPSGAAADPASSSHRTQP
eukprot:GHVU01030471.1.p1 GENE.GHVU01030471.1~~GHVU01030471.1.p1  ORF type:complete len:524 (-),score=73.27 GHVU01030471.1:289-1860(-)